MCSGPALTQGLPGGHRGPPAIHPKGGDCIAQPRWAGEKRGHLAIPSRQVPLSTCTPDRAPSTTTQCMYVVRILQEWGGDGGVGLVGRGGWGGYGGRRETFSWTTVLCLEGQTVSWTTEVKPRKGNIFPAPLPLQGLEGQTVSWATSFTTGRANRFRGHSHIDWQGPSLFRCHVYLGHWGRRVGWVGTDDRRTLRYGRRWERGRRVSATSTGRLGT